MQTSDDTPQAKDEGTPSEPFVGELFRMDIEETGGDRVVPPLLDMPGDEGMLSDEERKGLELSGPPPKKKQTEAPVLSLDFLNIESEEEPT